MAQNPKCTCGWHPHDNTPQRAAYPQHPEETARREVFPAEVVRDLDSARARRAHRIRQHQLGKLRRRYR